MIDKFRGGGGLWVSSLEVKGWMGSQTGESLKGSMSQEGGGSRALGRVSRYRGLKCGDGCLGWLWFRV